MEAVAGEEQRGQRLDTVVAAALPTISRAYVQKLCTQERICVNGHPEKPGYKLKVGDKVTVDYDPNGAEQPPAIELPILYEDNDCVVINKPAGVLTHAQGPHITEATVATFLRARLEPSDNQWGSGERIGIVHRLDRATSGVIICAKNQKALSYLQQQFARRHVQKTYVAVIEGHLKEPEAIIDVPIERNPKAPATFRAGANGKPAITRYKVLHEGPTRSLVELYPETGRTHQLRVHLKHLGHPIVGDPLYGHGTYGDRLYLHAASLAITLPSGERPVFTAPRPEYFTTEANR